MYSTSVCHVAATRSPKVISVFIRFHHVKQRTERGVCRSVQVRLVSELWQEPVAQTQVIEPENASG